MEDLGKRRGGHLFTMSANGQLTDWRQIPSLSAKAEGQSGFVYGNTFSYMTTNRKPGCRGWGLPDLSHLLEPWLVISCSHSWQPMPQSLSFKHSGQRAGWGLPGPRSLGSLHLRGVLWALVTEEHYVTPAHTRWRLEPSRRTVGNSTVTALQSFIWGAGGQTINATSNYKAHVDVQII